VERGLGVRPSAQLHAIEIFRRVDVIREVRDRNRHSDETDVLRRAAEPFCTPWSVERLEEVRRRQAQGIRAAVLGLDERDAAERRGGEQRTQVVGNDAGEVRIDDEHGTEVENAERSRDCLGLAAARIVDDLRTGTGCDTTAVIVRGDDDGAPDDGGRSEHVAQHPQHQGAVGALCEAGKPLLPFDSPEGDDDAGHLRRLSAVKRLTNGEIADKLEAFAALLDLSGAGYYTSRAYRRAAETIRETRAPIAELAAAGRAQELRGIGAGISARLQELVDTGRIAELDELESDVRPDLIGLGRLLGVGPKRMVEIGRALGVSTAEEFREAARAGRLTSVSGVGPQTEQRLLAALEREGRPQPRKGMTLNRARALLEEIAAGLGGELAGDPRRWSDLSFDFAVVCSAGDPQPVLAAFEALPSIVSVLDRAERRATGVTVEGVPVQLVVAEPERFGTELVVATGNPAYVEGLGPLPDAVDETALYAALGLPWCPPELREHPFRGEPPALLARTEIRGDLHMHSTWSDGKASILEMATAARDLGYEYVAICDHTPNVRVVPGLGADELRRQGEEIAEVNETLAPFRVLRGTEVDIRADGALDLPDDVLAELDWVQLSLHAGQRQSRDVLTRKVTEAMRHPAVRALSHPRGRIINHRPPNELDLERTFEVALETGVALETNGLPDRLDLSGAELKLAIEAGVPIVVSTDAHSVRGLGNMQLAVHTARRGWATAADVVNTRPVEEVLRRR
jgi:DNA polymerase (family 10)